VSRATAPLHATSTKPGEATSSSQRPPEPPSRSSGPATPEALSRDLVAAVNVGDLGAAASCFSRRARFVTPDETVVEGREAIARVLSQLIAMRVRIRVEPHRLTYLDDRALLSERWRMRHTDVEGHGPFEQVTRALGLHSRVEGEGWKIIFLAPWGFS
jgi:ketosteroid isomerase-like protein